MSWRPNGLKPFRDREQYIIIDGLHQLKPQYDQIGRYLKVLNNKFAYKSSQNTWWLCGLFKNIIIKNKQFIATYCLDSFRKNWDIFYSNM